MSVSNGQIVVQKNNIVVPKQKARKIPWDVIQAKRTAIGKAGEEFVYNRECEWVQKHCPSELSRVEWSSQVRGDGLGYDIRTVCHENPSFDLLLEVKTTCSDKIDVPFQMSANELKFFESILPSNEVLQLHRLYNAKNNMTDFDCFIVSQNEILDKYLCIPTCYNMVLK